MSNKATNTNTDIFEFATRNKIHFASSRGEINVEQLWDVPLTSRDGFDLDNIAKTANKALKAVAEESFVKTDSKKSVAQVRLESAFEVIKYVITTKLAEDEAAKKRAENRQKREVLLTALAEKEKGELSEMSKKDLLKQINALESDE